MGFAPLAHLSQAFEEYTAYWVDLPGHGLSLGICLPSIGVYAGRIGGMKPALDIRDSVLVGHGMGGLVALTSASGHRELFGVGFLINTVPPLFFQGRCCIPCGLDGSLVRSSDF